MKSERKKSQSLNDEHEFSQDNSRQDDSKKERQPQQHDPQQYDEENLGSNQDDDQSRTYSTRNDVSNGKNKGFSSSDFSNSASKKTSCGTISPWDVVRFPVNQLNDFINSATAPFVFTQFVPSPANPGDLSLKTWAFVLAYLAQDVLSNLKYSIFRDSGKFQTYHKKDMRAARNKYMVSAIVGLVVLTGLGLGAEFGLPELEKLIPDMLQSGVDSLKEFGEALQYAFDNREDILALILGTIGYAGYKLSSGGVRLLQDCFMPSTSLALTHEQMETPPYQFGHYAFRLFNRYAVTETTLYFLREFSQPMLAVNPLLQLGVFFGSELAFKGVDALNAPAPESKDDYDEPSCGQKFHQVLKGAGKAILSEGAQFGIGYVVIELGINQFNVLVGDFTKDTQKNRAIKLAAAEIVGKGLTLLGMWAASKMCRKKSEYDDSQERAPLIRKEFQS